MKTQATLLAAVAAVTLGWFYNHQRNGAHGATSGGQTTPTQVLSPTVSLRPLPAALAPATATVRRSPPQSPLPPSALEHHLEQITGLSQVVFPTAQKLEALRPLLNDPELIGAIRDALDDTRTNSGKAFTRKLRLLDALYDGLKFPDAATREKFTVAATEILSEAPPAGFSADPELQRQFLADRTEIALALIKTLPETAQQVRALGNPNAERAFKQAILLKSTYEVAL